jgi:hypothetical protein
MYDDRSVAASTCGEKQSIPSASSATAPEILCDAVPATFFSEKSRRAEQEQSAKKERRTYRMRTHTFSNQLVLNQARPM